MAGTNDGVAAERGGNQGGGGAFAAVRATPRASSLGGGAAIGCWNRFFQTGEDLDSNEAT